MDNVKLLRFPDVASMMGLKRSAIYRQIEDGLITKPIKLSRRASLWPDYEIQAVIKAIINNADKTERKSLVQELMASRKGV